MRVILRTGSGGLEKPVIRESPEREPNDRHALIAVKRIGTLESA